eukprot:TRINITY_DN539_c0_g1_i1.p1 TRINITY_DN539_c0_g1~~TRINITY_DN539_c0_g1_i1.p1  ORF type:complete len:423 (-),score=65.31 TRINITY_DN539_c0_g1_i1:93-1172(-)
MRELGYTYVNIDAGWLKGRDPTTQKMVSDPVKFPEGMKAVGDYLHSLGLKFGLYTTRGTVQCGTSEYSNVPGSYGHYTSDVDQMVGFGMDYLKVDSCGATQDHQQAFAEYGQIRDALNATKRPVFFSLCGWYSWYAPVGYSLGNSWRIAGDGDNWGDILNIINTNVDLYSYPHSGGWNDADLLIGTGAGSYGPSRQGWYITDVQSRSQFSMYAVMSSPLLISADLGGVSSYALTTWTNREVIAVNQDLGRSGFPVQGQRLGGHSLRGNQGWNVWGKALSTGAFAVVFLNNEPHQQNVTCDSKCLSAMQWRGHKELTVRDLYLHKTVEVLPSSATSLSLLVDGGGATRIVTLTPTSTFVN